MGKRDQKAPNSLQIIICNEQGQEWGRLYASAREFSTGSVGYYANGKLNNPANPDAKYQAGLTFTLIGSKG